MSDDLVMERGHTIMGTVDTIGRLAGSLHRDPGNRRYRQLVEMCPSPAVMMGLLLIMEGVSEHLDGELSATDLIAIGVERSKELTVREVAEYLDMQERGLDPDDPFAPYCS